MRNNLIRSILLIMAFSLFSLSFIKDVYSISMGDMAADFTLKEIKGEEIVLFDILKDRKAVLVFWATWCPHCRTEIPHIEKFYAENKDKVAVIGIDVGESKRKVENFVRKMKISYPIALDSDGRVSELYNVRGIPTIVAVSKERKILYYGHSMEEMGDKIEF